MRRRRLIRSKFTVVRSRSHPATTGSERRGTCLGATVPHDTLAYRRICQVHTYEYIELYAPPDMRPVELPQYYRHGLPIAPSNLHDNSSRRLLFLGGAGDEQ